MSSHLDLDEQEQLEKVKHFWNSYGNLISWALVVVLLSYSGWNAWQWWQRDQGLKAAGMYEELGRAAGAGDVERAGKISAELKDRYGRTTYAEQGGLRVAQLQFDKGQRDAAIASLSWVADNAREGEYRAIARLRLAALLSEQGKHDEALALLAKDMPPDFTALVADRRGDVLLAQGKTAEAVTAYQQAWRAMDPALDYRRLIDAKLTTLGAAPAQDGAASEAAR
ncbi:MAG: hypothetical protein RJA44_1524 [Pseudomonadota bacterium]|jgi:predicted negative regulator of RcsB-dependent stress response